MAHKLIIFLILFIGSYDYIHAQENSKKGEVQSKGGLYTFGFGKDGGLNGRKPIKLRRPSCEIPENVSLTYQVCLNPDGNVISVEPLKTETTNDIEMEVAVIEAIKNWHFSKLPDNSPQQNQIFTVRISGKKFSLPIE